MARLKLAPSTYPEGYPDSRLPTLQAPKILSRLELLRNDYQERTLRAKEEKMLNILTHQQERISHRVTGPTLYTQHRSFHELHQNPYSGLWASEEKAWASNWTVSKRTAGIDRAHPLKPVYHHKATVHVPDTHHPPSAHSTRYKSSLPPQEQLRSKSGPARTDTWRQLEKKESSLEAEIRRKEALLREKLRKTEEELRRIQREKEEAEMQDRRVPEMQNTRQGRAATTQKRTAKTYPNPEYSEEEDRGDRNHAGGDRYHAGGGIHHPERNRQHPGGDRRVPEMQNTRRGRMATIQNRTTKTYHDPDYSEEEDGGDRHHPGGDRLYQNREAETQILGPTSDRKAKHIRQMENVTLSPIEGSSHIAGAPESLHSHRSSMSGPIQEDNGEDLVPCQLCGRNFMVKRLEKHTEVCQKLMNSKRKVFDSSKARAKGTDLEQFINTKGKPKDPPPQVKRSSWRQKHESFMRTIRQARLVQDVVSRGGKLSDLPPPPPEENPDYITCPHCNRRFAPAAAERHIPKCETIKSKPRPLPSRRR